MVNKSQYMQDDNTIDVIYAGGVEKGDWANFFGPTLPNAIPLEGDFTTIMDILVVTGLAPSKSWCRKNKWDWPLEQGYSEVTFGKLRVKICILTRWPEMETI